MVGARKYEALQARWRREVLELPAGPPTHPTSRLSSVEHCLPRAVDGVTAKDAGWNFLSNAAHSYALRRASGPGLTFEDRLWRNLLSSQPLAFNIAGECRSHSAAASRWLAELARTGPATLSALGDPAHDAYALDGLDAEWAPPKALHTGDQSGCDMAALLALDDGGRILVTAEVKYTDTFSPGFRGTKLDNKLIQHREHLAALGIEEPAARTLLEASATSQFLRSVMLTDSVVRQGLRGGDPLNAGLAVVLALKGDDAARRSVDLLGAALRTSRVCVEFWALEDVLDCAADRPQLQQWAGTMRRRYLTGPA